MLRGCRRLRLERPPLPLPPEGHGALETRPPASPIRVGTPEGSSADGSTQHQHGLCRGWGWQCRGGPTRAQRLAGVHPSSPQCAHAHPTP